MTSRRVRASHIDFTPLRRELKLPEQFPSEAQQAAEAAVGAAPAPPRDLTDVPFVTIDPAESRDLDQAMELSRRTGGGFRVRYAIADVAAFVQPDGPLDREACVRGQTIYLPDGKVPLYPQVLSEGAASLLPDQVRPAVVWTIDLDADGATTAVQVERAAVRSRAKLDYAGVQADAAAGRLAEPIALLPELGKLLIDRGLARGAINLPIPEQEVEPVNGQDGAAGWRLTLRAPVPMEEYNAQISLLTGAAAAEIMLAGRVGLLRTMPPPPKEAVDKLRAAARGLGIDWSAGDTPGMVLARIDPADPRGAAFVDQAAELLRGAGYTAFDGELPEQPAHAAVASTYAHVTAPLRRLADRYVAETCLALHAGQEVPAWARHALPNLVEVMSGTDRLAGTAERGAIDLAEAVLLAGRVGEQFDAAVLDVDSGRKSPGGAVALDDPPVRARCEGVLPLGERIRVTLTEADPDRRRVLFTLA